MSCLAGARFRACIFTLIIIAREPLVHAGVVALLSVCLSDFLLSRSLGVAAALACQGRLRIYAHCAQRMERERNHLACGRSASQQPAKSSAANALVHVAFPKVRETTVWPGRARCRQAASPWDVSARGGCSATRATLPAACSVSHSPDGG